jgi:magnesium chelatase family protein
MLAKASSVALIGVDALEVTVEVDVAPGLPNFQVVGLPDQAVSEARERVRAAIKNSGLPFPAARITVNLAPADLRKEGPMFDLPIALCLLAAQGMVPTAALERTLIAGELALEGSLRPVSGILNLALKALTLEGLEVYAPASLLEAVRHLNGQAKLERANPSDAPESEETYLDLLDIKGQAQGKRALEIAAAGGHNLLMIGSPGSGKTMLARRMPGLLPSLTRGEALEVTRIHSAAGKLAARGGLIQNPVFRAPHHTVSDAGLIGGGSIPRPGEVSLAHLGLLFMDEFPEFSQKALETLRQPLEDGTVTISRARASVSYPARFQLLAAMNPCKCGYWGDTQRPCTCSPHERTRYLARISGPLLDRLDLVVGVPRLSVEELSRAQEGENSAKVKERVQGARVQMLERQGGRNSALQGAALREHTQLTPSARGFLEAAAKQLQLTGRGFDRVLRVARTVADLAGSSSVHEMHLAEAVAYRPRELMGV